MALAEWDLDPTCVRPHTRLTTRRVAPFSLLSPRRTTQRVVARRWVALRRVGDRRGRRRRRKRHDLRASLSQLPLKRAIIMMNLQNIRV